MKKTVLTVTFIFSLFTMLAQSWSPLDLGTNNWVVSLKVYNTTLYAGGNFTKAGADTTDNIANWNGVKWIPFVKGADYPVSSMEVIGGNLYVGGMFLNIDGTPATRIAKFDGSTFTAMGTGIPGAANCIAEYKGEIYASTLGGMRKWNGASWVNLGAGVGGNNPYPYALKVYKDALYVGGSFEKAGNLTANGIAKWDGSNWSVLGSGLNKDGIVFSLEVFNGELYVGGLYDSVNKIPAHCFSKWNGTTWSAVGNGASGGRPNFDTRVGALKTVGNSLYIGGDFDSISGTAANFIARYNGTSFFKLASGMNAPVYAFEEYKGDLIAGGEFSTAGGITANNIAKWAIPTGIGTIVSTHEVSAFPNPFCTTTTIRFEDQSQPSDLSIYDIVGKKIKTINSFIENSIEMRRENLPAGIYFYEINWKDHSLSKGKLIVAD